MLNASLFRVSFMAASSSMAESAEERQLAVIFKGLQQPTARSEIFDMIVSGVVFIQQLAITDKLFAMVYKDFHEQVEKMPPAADQCIKNWHVINAVLFDHGLEISDESTFAILAGQFHVAAVFANEIQRFTDKSFQRQLLIRVGPEVPIRQRVHPFLGQAVPTKSTSGARGVSQLVAQPTRIFLADQSRFAKKRALMVDAHQKLVERELKAQRLREKAERASQKAVDEAKSQEAMASLAKDKMMKDQLMMYSGDPDRMAEKAKRTELLKQLEMLETDYQADQKRMSRLKAVGMDSPRRVIQAERALQTTEVLLTRKTGKVVSPVRIKDESSIPFSHTPGAAQKKKKLATTRKGARSVEPISGTYHPDVKGSFTPDPDADHM